MSENAVNRVASYAAKLRFEDLSEAAVASVRRVIIDTLGVTIGGYQTSLGQRCAAFAAIAQPGQDASIWGDGRCSSLEWAAWANAVNACILGMSDSHRLCSHVASEVVPTALAVGEARRLSGREVMTAIAIGYDVFGVIQPHVKMPQRERGLDHKGQAGSLASAVVAARTMGLPQGQIANALALAADMACGTEQYTFDAGHCDTEGLTAGFGVRNGIAAAKLAEFGFRGPPGALDGSYGYFHAFGGGYQPSYLDSLGNGFMVESTALKPHSGCRHVHACVDATQDLLRKGRPDLEQITAIEVGTYRYATMPEFRVNPNPQDVEAAGYSLPATVAVALARGSWYREDIEAYNEPRIRRLWPLVKVYVEESIEREYPAKNGCVVRVTTADGTRYEGRVDYAKGEPENMLTPDELRQKFDRVVNGFLPARQIDQIFELANHLEQVEDVGDLVRLTYSA